MKTLARIVSILVLAVTLSGCGTGMNLPPQLKDTMAQACEFYQKAKPSIVAYRNWAHEHWNDLVTMPDGSTGPLIPHEAKAILTELDSYLPALDNAGQLVCLVASDSGLPQPEQQSIGRSIDWDRVLSVTIKAATLAVQLKAQGVI